MVSGESLKYIETRGYTKGDGDGVAWSEAVNESIKALAWLSRAELPELDSSEWEYILNCYTSRNVEYSFPLRIASDLMDNVGALELSELSKDYAALVKKCHAMTQAQQFAIMNYVRMFWTKDRKAESFDATIQAIIDEM